MRYQMFHVKIFLLITIASIACLAQDDWDDYYNKKECDVDTETCLIQDDWKDYFIQGECDKFNEAIAKLKDWVVTKEELPTLIERSYSGNLNMAQNIYDCLSKMYQGSTFEVYEDKVKGFIALGRALNVENQRATPVSLNTAILMSQLTTAAKTIAKSNWQYFENLVNEYKEEVLPSIKSMCFDDWVFINYTNEFNKTYGLAIAEYNKVNLWPTPASNIGDSQRKWYVTERKFRNNKYGIPVIDAIFKSVDRRRVLTSEENGDVSSTMIGYIKNGSYHVWTAEFLSENMNDGKFRFKNRQTCKYLKNVRYHNPQIIDYKPGPIQAILVGTNVDEATYYNVG